MKQVIHSAVLAAPLALVAATTFASCRANDLAGTRWSLASETIQDGWSFLCEVEIGALDPKTGSSSVKSTSCTKISNEFGDPATLTINGHLAVGGACGISGNLNYVHAPQLGESDHLEISGRLGASASVIVAIGTALTTSDPVERTPINAVRY